MKTISYYDTHADSFEEQYLSVDTEYVHNDWINDYLPESGNVLDVGAGIGRDALYFAKKGLNVIAVEPSKEFLKKGEKLTQHLGVKWLDDTLPELKATSSLQIKYDLIVLSAVWMHIPKNDRDRAFRKLANLLKPSGVLIITLRHGTSPDEREMHQVSADEISAFCQKHGLTFKLLDNNKDQLKRNDVTWQTVVATLPDDGTGYFPIIRNIVINDAKSSTYKLALLRTLVRIADGHPGAAINNDDNYVVLPLGLVALYWIRQYKPLLEVSFKQSSANNLGFIKKDGWELLSDISTQDFSVGQTFIGDEAKAVHNTLKHVASLIRRMPANYITFPGSDNKVFTVNTFRNRLNQVKSTKNTKTYKTILDNKTLSSYGEFVMPYQMWQSMSFYACWIEPVILNEWASVMQIYNLNQPKHVLLNRLDWLEAERNTTETRKKISDLLQNDNQINCVWSRNEITKNYAVDHCLPFSRWPNNDLWNLLPTLERVNLQKSDKLPSKSQLFSSKDLIINWWQTAWNSPEEQNKFFTQADLTLPKITSDTNDYEAVFEALQIQTLRLFDQQQISSWQFKS